MEITPSGHILGDEDKDKETVKMYKNKQKKEKFCVHIFAGLFLSLDESTCETRKNVFYFTSKALFTSKAQIFKFHEVIKCVSIKQDIYFTE